MKPLVGISCCTKLFGTFGMANHAASDTYIRATEQVVGAVPVLLPASRTACDIPTLLARLDGIILTGSRSNVQPSLYDGPPHAEGTPEDPARDGVTLPLIRAAIRHGIAAARDLPRHAGAERGARRLAAPADPGSAGPDGPLDADAGQQPRAHRQGARRGRGAGKLAAPGGGGDHDLDQLAAQPGCGPARAWLVAEGKRAGWHDRGRAGCGRAGVCRGGAVASGVRLDARMPCPAAILAAFGDGRCGARIDWRRTRIAEADCRRGWRLLLTASCDPVRQFRWFGRADVALGSVASHRQGSIHAMAETVIPPPPRSPCPSRAAAFPVRRIFCVGRNYAAHAREMGHDPDREAAVLLHQARRRAGHRRRGHAVSDDDRRTCTTRWSRWWRSAPAAPTSPRRTR